MEVRDQIRLSPFVSSDTHRSSTSDTHYADLTHALVRTLAVENRRLQDALAHESIRDRVTELFTRRYLEESLERELSRVRLSHSVLSIALFRLEHLSTFESECGRAATDILLKAVSYVVKSHVRAEDICCRFSADQFAFAMFGAPLFAVHNRADMVRENIKTIEWCNNSRLSTGITLSAGVASFPEHATTAPALLEAAHSALHRAVECGCDRVAIPAQDRKSG